MNVRCPRCLSVQTLDVALAPGETKRASCPGCGASFSVRSKATVAVPAPAAAPEPAAGATARWQVTKRDGTTLQFPNLLVFQKWVVDGVVAVDDSISRNGHVWRPIAEIPELLGLFERVAADRRAAGEAGPPELPPPEIPQADEPTPPGAAPAVAEERDTLDESPSLASPRAPEPPPENATLRDFRLDADAPLTDSQEMELAGSTLEIRVPEPAFELGKAIDLDLSTVRAAPPPPPPRPAHDPFATTLPEFDLGAATATAKTAAKASERAVPLPPVMEGGPRLDPEKHAQPVRALKTLSAPPSDTASMVDEKRHLDPYGPAKMMAAGAALALIGVGAWWAFTPEATPPDKGSVREAAEPRAVAAATARGAEPAEPLQDGEPGRAAEPEEPEAAPEAAPEASPEGTEPTAPGEAAAAPGEAVAKVETEPKGEPKPKVEAEPKPKVEAEPKADPKAEPPAPTSYDGLMTAAAAALKAGSHARAIAYFREASRANPRTVEPIAKMGMAYLRMGNATEAILKFEEARQKNPGYRDTYVGLGKALERAGRVGDAITVYRQYLRMCPECSKSKGVRASLMRLGAEP